MKHVRARKAWRCRLFGHAFPVFRCIDGEWGIQCLRCGRFER